MRERIMRTCLAAVLLCAVLPMTAAFAEDATVTGNDVNMRYGPGTGYGVVECLPKGTVVTVIDRSNASWYAISYNGQDGYMSSRYLSVEKEAAAEITEGSTTADGFINAMYVNFRSAPSSSASILGQYNKGKIVTVNGYSGDWAYVTIDGEDGYIYRSYITPGFAASTEINYVFSGGDNNGYANEYVEPTPTPAPAETPAPTQKPATEATDEPTPTPTPAPSTEIPSGSYRGHITGDYVRFRTGPSTSYSIIDSYNKGTELAALAQEGEWVKAIINGQEGYVYAQYVYIDDQPDISDIINGTSRPQEPAKPAETPTPTPTPEPSKAPEIEKTESAAGYISGNDVRFRSGPSMSSDIIGTFYYGNSVTITGYSGDWTAVEYKGSSGFVYSQYVKNGSFSVGGGDSSSDPGSSTGSATGRQIADFALQYVGYNYCWGGTSPETGFDCSGLVFYTYKNFGYTLNRVAADQANNGYAVSYDELQPGDILCFYSSGSYIGHVGIYIGDGMFVHASNATTGVIITPLDGYYYNRGFVARRII